MSDDIQLWHTLTQDQWDDLEQRRIRIQVNKYGRVTAKMDKLQATDRTARMAIEKLMAK